MRGDPQILEALNEILTAELTAINQYFIHAKMCANWGYHRLAKKKRDESIDEMKDADAVIERILYLDGVPNMQRMNPVRVGEDPIEQHRLDLTLETERRRALQPRHRAGAREGRQRHARAARDASSHGEEDSVDWLESQLHVVEQIGKERYLAEQMGDDTN